MSDDDQRKLLQTFVTHTKNIKHMSMNTTQFDPNLRKKTRTLTNYIKIFI